MNIFFKSLDFFKMHKKNNLFLVIETDAIKYNH